MRSFNGIPLRLRSARAKAFARAERSRTLLDLPEQAASNPVSRQPTQTSGVRKRLPFPLCIRSEVTPPLSSHLVWCFPFGQKLVHKLPRSLASLLAPSLAPTFSVPLSRGGDFALWRESERYVIIFERNSVRFFFLVVALSLPCSLPLSLQLFLIYGFRVLRSPVAVIFDDSGGNLPMLFAQRPAYTREEALRVQNYGRRHLVSKVSP